MDEGELTDAGGTAARRHRIAPSTTWPWMPMVGNGVLAKHPWCDICGEIQVLGSERAVPLGSLANVIGRLDRRLRHDGLKITEVQKRLLMQRIAQVGGADTFSLPYEAQFRIVQCAVSDLLGLSPAVVAAHLRSC